MSKMIEHEIRTIEPRTTIAVRLETTQDQLSAVFDRELPRVGARMAELGAEMAGPPYARYFDFSPGHVDLEIGAPIVAAPAGLAQLTGRPEGEIGLSGLPGGDVATTIHEGSYDGLSATYDGLHAAIHADGRDDGVGPWEEYLTDPGREPDPAAWRTLVVWPLA